MGLIFALIPSWLCLVALQHSTGATAAQQSSRHFTCDAIALPNNTVHVGTNVTVLCNCSSAIATGLQLRNTSRQRVVSRFPCHQHNSTVAVCAEFRSIAAGAIFDCVTDSAENHSLGLHAKLTAGYSPRVRDIDCLWHRQGGNLSCRVQPSLQLMRTATGVQSAMGELSLRMWFSNSTTGLRLCDGPGAACSCDTAGRCVWTESLRPANQTVRLVARVCNRLNWCGWHNTSALLADVEQPQAPQQLELESVSTTLAVFSIRPPPDELPLTFELEAVGADRRRLLPSDGVVGRVPVAPGANFSVRARSRLLSGRGRPSRWTRPPLLLTVPVGNLTVTDPDDGAASGHRDRLVDLAAAAAVAVVVAVIAAAAVLLICCRRRRRRRPRIPPADDQLYPEQGLEMLADDKYSSTLRPGTQEVHLPSSVTSNVVHEVQQNGSYRNDTDYVDRNS